jgi:hypothetical protein
MTVLWLATGATLLLVGTVLLGRRLQRPAHGERRRRRRRRWNLAKMVGIVTLIAAHIALNSPTLHLGR